MNLKSALSSADSAKQEADGATTPIDKVKHLLKEKKLLSKALNALQDRHKSLLNEA